MSISVFNEPINEEIASFVGVENIVNGESVSSQEGVVSIDIGDHQTSPVSDLVDDKVNVFIAPEDIVLTEARLKSSTRNSIFEKITGIAQIDVTFVHTWTMVSLF